MLRNMAANGDRSLDGTIINAAWGNGRVAGKHALRFGGQDDCVCLNLPQTTNNLTLSAWVFVDSLSGVNTGLVMSDGFFRNGQMHWQLSPSGGIGFDLFESDQGFDCHYFTAPTFSIDRLHRWTHLAVVYDHAAGKVRFFVDGELFEEKDIGKHVPIQIGEARIGLWKPNDPLTMDARNLFGWFDELAIFGRPLATEEIRQLYEIGNPVEASQVNSNSQER